MGLTKPQFSMAVTLTSAWTIDVTLTGVSFTASVAAGTYYLDGTALEFFSALAIALTVADISATGDGTAVWTVVADPTTGQVTIERTGLSKLLTKFDFDVGEGRTVGASQDSYTGSGDSEFTVFAGTTITFEGAHQARYIWLPREYLMRDERKPARTVARDQSVTGRVITDGFGAGTGWHNAPILIQPVQGALVYQWMTDDTDFAGVIAGLAAGDPNASLEAFWWDLMEQSQDGTPPTVRVAPDSTSLSTYSDVWMTGEDWLQDMDTALSEIVGNPVQYTVEIPAQTVVT